MQKLPVGLSDFKQVIEKNYYYVDKSLFIKELMDEGAVAMLIPRPRRFGKTLNLSMLRYFFEKTAEDTSRLFRHLKIWQAGEEYTNHQGKYPVIFLTFKDLKERDWKSALRKIKQLIKKEFLRHKYLRTGKHLEAEERDYFNGIAKLTADLGDYESSLEQLSDYLARYYHQKVILLIDEYDTPIQAGYVNGYYKDVISFMRNFLSGGLKDNLNLEKGVLTGIMRVAKESIFSGLNNLSVFTLLRREFSAAFGLTENEVEQALRDFQLIDQYENVRNWYNGYVFSDQIIYNPWSIINYLDSADNEFLPYWANTSDNAIIEQLLTRGGTGLKAELESLIKGGTIEKPIEENIVFRDIEKKDHLLWSFLLFSGYLKYVEKRTVNHKTLFSLQIPNLEVGSIYDHLVQGWLEARLENEKLETMLKALLDGDMETFEELFAEMVKNSFSFFDTGGDPEKVYQAFTIGLLVRLSGSYEVKSNGESGYGRYDVMLIPRDTRATGVIIEFKKVNKKRGETKERAMTKAFQQIEDKNYAGELLGRGIQQIRKLAIVFEGKRVWVREQRA
jgi:hypothetical protein